MSLQVSWAAPLSWTGSADFSRAHSACLWQLAGWRWQRRLTATCHCPAGSPELVHRVAAALQKNQQKPESFLRPKLGTALISTRSIDQSKLQGPPRFGRRRSCKGHDQREGSLCGNLRQAVTGIGCIWNSDPSVGDILIAYKICPRWKGRAIIIKMIKAWNWETEVQILALVTYFCNLYKSLNFPGRLIHLNFRVFVYNFL